MKTLLTLAIAALGAAYATGALALPTGNLLTNPGFEASATQLTGWTNSNAAIRDQDPVAHGGSNYVFGPSTPTFTVSQTIDLIAAGVQASDIDAGGLGIDFGGWQSGWNSQTDYGQIFITLFDGTNAEIGSASLAAFYSASTWVEQSGSAALLAGTRFIQYQFVGTRVDGSNNDAYLDDAYLDITGSVTPPTPPTGVPEPPALALFGLGLAGLGLARWRLARR